jgi:Glycosyltransferase family 92
VGAERFFLFDNESADDHAEVLRPYVEEGVVEITEWASRPDERHWNLRVAFNDCLDRHREDARWIAFLDIDEFLFSPTGRPVSDVLTEFEQFSGVEVSTLSFGPSGHRAKPPGLVIESYVDRRSYASRDEDLEQVKSIVDPLRVERNFNAHGFLYKEGHAVHEDGSRASQDPPGSQVFPQASLLRINHYITKSIDEYETKRAQWAAAGRSRRPLRPRWLEELSAERDDAITMYVPALREALRLRG